MNMPAERNDHLKPITVGRVARALKPLIYVTPIGPIWILVMSFFQLLLYVITGFLIGLQAIYWTVRRTPRPAAIRNSFWILKHRKSAAAIQGMKVIRNTFISVGLLVLILLVLWGVVSPLMLLLVGLPVVAVLGVGVYIALRGQPHE